MLSGLDSPVRCSASSSEGNTISARGRISAAAALALPYLDTLRWLFIAVALAGIAAAIWARIDDWKRGLR
jgi:hypothetical protein